MLRGLSGRSIIEREFSNVHPLAYPTDIYTLRLYCNNHFLAKRPLDDHCFLMCSRSIIKKKCPNPNSTNTPFFDFGHCEYINLDLRLFNHHDPSVCLFVCLSLDITGFGSESENGSVTHTYIMPMFMVLVHGMAIAKS